MTVLRSLLHQSQECWSMGKLTLTRFFASQVETIQGLGQVLRLENDDPMIHMVVVQPEERTWGPTHKLPQKIQQGLGLTADHTVGILRPAFAPHDYPIQPLTQIMKDVGGGKVAISCKLFESPKDRMVVDVYIQQEGEDDHIIEDVAVDVADLLDSMDLQHIPTNTPILVVSVHLFWNPAWPDIKIGQAALLCQRLRTFLQEGGYQGSEVSQMPCIIGGDFNSMHKKTYTDEYDELPKGKEYLVSGVYSLLRNGQLDSEHHDHPLTRRRTEEKLVFNTAGFNFESIYNKGGWNEPHNTNKTSEFAGCLDYVFVSPHFEVQELLQTLQEDSDPYLTLGYPSDHLAIGGLLSLNL
eukprot:TRINITY_DN4977_c0_g1_i2.p2 TRINITY_DN4977_c0_g1~~TRINITY_DN4977_c0_g1_i2.p2  ORF type:complete len:353 (+),score=38.11 TRINITY_DN4977_c0_g1_i2:63-1121(+)